MSKFRFSFIATAATLVAISIPLSQSSHVQAKELARSAHLPFLAIQAESAPPQGKNPADELPPGDGRDVAFRVCTQCHSVSNFAHLRYAKDKWDSVLDDMTSKGMTASDEDMATVEKYLTTYLAPDSQSNGSSDSSPAPKNN